MTKPLPASLREATFEDDKTYGTDVLGGSEDYVYEDGTIRGVCTIFQDILTIHIFGYHKENSHRRTGAGRRALSALAPHFKGIIANGVERNSDAERFWKEMRAEGLITEIIHC